MDRRISLEQRWELMTETEQNTIRQIHLWLQQIKVHPERYVDPVRTIQDAEFLLQGIWKFEEIDEKYHTHWTDISGCTCPRMDNRDAMYYGGGKITVSDCPWHWQWEKTNG